MLWGFSLHTLHFNCWGNAMENEWQKEVSVNLALECVEGRNISASSLYVEHILKTEQCQPWTVFIYLFILQLILIRAAVQFKYFVLVLGTVLSLSILLVFCISGAFRSCWVWAYWKQVFIIIINSCCPSSVRIHTDLPHFLKGDFYLK